MSVRSLNKVMLIGNLTRDPNFRYTPNNTAVCSFGIATNRSWSNDDGTSQEQVEFHNIVAWRKLADICNQLLHKGDKVFVEGRLQTREWQGDDGNTRRMTEVVIDNMILLRSRSGSSSSDDTSSQQSDDSTTKASASKGKNNTPVSDDVTDVEDIADDVPF